MADSGFGFVWAAKEKELLMFSKWTSAILILCGMD